MARLKIFQLIVAAIAAYSLGLYTVKFTGAVWDWTNVAGALGCIAVLGINLLLLIRDFWKQYS
ncbi:MAG TPA: hypothetical protein VGH49_08335 [Xanthobacteraceae bacterium]|jgi:hypothetical protein